ncbi:MAG: DUF1501 domain-containing protein [Planctomycetota bacterium]|nr:MAG: DUF1501 domain-containing protein [Planctomycetota bacterium]
MDIPKARAATRRWFLKQCSVGVGQLALGALLARDGLASAPSRTLARGERAPHFAPKAKRVLYLHMAGSPSQIDLLDAKPKLQELNGEVVPESLIAGERFAFISASPKILASPYSFARHGQSGQEISELLPHLAGVADELAIVRSMHTDQFNHGPAQIYMNTGHFRIGRPSMGAWLSYGLGSENEDLPAFVVLLSGDFAPSGGSSCWGSGFLPTIHQGVRFRSYGDPVLFLSNPDGVDGATRRRSIDAINALNTIQLEDVGDPEIATRIAQYEMAFRMQTSVPELQDLRSEPQAVLDLYGAEPGRPSFANNCLLARRLLERGTRFVQIYHWGWDTHGSGPGDDIIKALPERCQETDRACAALLIDLKRRGLLEDTLVVWGGEFGRTPMNEERNGSTYLGRDHHRRCFTMWLAGAGIRPGITIGATDELGYDIVEDPISVNDLHATMLHLLGLDHEKLVYRYQGRDFRLTDVAGVVVDKLLA